MKKSWNQVITFSCWWKRWIGKSIEMAVYQVYEKIKRTEKIEKLAQLFDNLTLLIWW